MTTAKTFASSRSRMYETGLHHPLHRIRRSATNGSFDDRAWKIPGVRENEALKEIFVEVIDDRRSNVLLTRFPEKKPTLVHADLENPFIRAYGVFFQRALERQMPSVAEKARTISASDLAQSGA